MGEIHLEDFEVSHTKDDIIWDGDEEDELQRKLYQSCGEYRRVAADRRKGQDSRRPNAIQLRTAVNQVQSELNSDEIVDILNLTELPPVTALDHSVRDLVEGEARREPTIVATLGNMLVKVFISEDLSERDFYFTYELPRDNELHVVVNMAHPYLTQVPGSDGLANYLRQCIFDAISEHKTHVQRGTIHSNTVRFWKDHLLRIPLLIQDDDVADETEDLVAALVGEGVSASVSLFITQAQKATLREQGYSDQQIRDMRPEDAHRALGLID